MTILFFTLDGGEYNGYPMFMIDPKEGIVQVAGRLDYESKSEYNLNISVTDGQSFANCMVRKSLPATLALSL